MMFRAIKCPERGIFTLNFIFRISYIIGTLGDVFMGRKYSKNVQKLIRKIKYQCKLLDVEFSLANSYSVYTKEGSSCYGFFSPPTALRRGTLRVGIADKPLEEWVLTLAHEYAHMMQWFNEDKLFMDYEKDDSLYYELEIKTEKQAFVILKESGIRISESLKTRSRKYIRSVRENYLMTKKKSKRSSKKS